MRVDALALEDFRNYRRLEAAFSPGVNVIYGLKQNADILSVGE